MSRKWSFFIGAALLGGYILLAYGAPPVAVIAGVAIAGLVTYWRPRTD